MAANKRTGGEAPDILSPLFLEKLVTPLQYDLLADMLIRKLGKYEIRVTARQRSGLKRWLEQGANGEVPLPQARDSGRKIAIEFTSRDERRLNGRLSSEIADIVAEVTRTAAERMAPRALRGTESELARAVNLDALFVREFEQRLARRWKRPIELLQVQRHLACALGADINDELRRNAGKRKRPLVDVLTSLHARACQISGEVLVLLGAGYADAAMARWRSLHEASIVLQFIDKHGAATAKRYLEHEAVESWKGAFEYAAHCDRLGFEAIDDKQLPRIKAAHDAAVKKHGRSFKSAYGWAANALNLNKERISFDDVEKGLGLEHWRPFYRLASHPIHANPKSIKYRLCLAEGAPPCLPAGPSDYGLADPGQNTGLSLAQATAVLIARAPTSERLVAMYVMKELASRIARAFVAVQRRMERRQPRANSPKISSRPKGRKS